MLFIELFIPPNALDAGQRRQVAQRFMGSMTGTQEEAAFDPRSADIFASQFHVVVHRPETWVVGETPLGADGPFPYMVRVYVPGSWRKDTSPYVIDAFTDIIKDMDPQAAVKVHVLGVPEGSIGVDGEPKTSEGLVDLMNEPLKQDYAEGKALKDPMCDMLVHPDKSPTLEWEGTLYGFCCVECRDEFVKQREKKEKRAEEKQERQSAGT